MASRYLQILAAALALAPIAADAQKMSTFRCQGKDGKKYYGNTIPQQCYGRKVEQINAQGLVIKRIDPDAKGMSEQELAEKEAEKARRAKADAANREATRRDRALLATYTSEKDIEEQRRRALADNQKATREVEGRLAELKKRRASFDKELEFYQDKKVGKAKPPAKLQEEIRQAEFDLKVQEEALAKRMQEIATINAKYDDDKKRYVALTKR